MRLLTKAAVGIGVVVIGIGVAYVNLDHSAKPADNGQQVAQTGQTPTPTSDQPVRVEQPSALTGSGTEGAASDPGGTRTSHEASPAPVTVETGRSPAADNRTFRPELSTTTEAPSVVVLPSPRTGLAGGGFGSHADETPGRTPSTGGNNSEEAAEPDASADTATRTDHGTETTVTTGSETAPPAPAPTGTDTPIPAAPTVATTDVKPEAGETRTHVIQSGETFSSLAVKYFHHAKYAPLIVKANPDKDPRKLLVGAKINIPPAPADAAKPAVEPGRSTDAASSPPSTTTTIERTAPAPATTTDRPAVAPAVPAIRAGSERTYTVQSGEGWYELADRFLGKGTDWPELFEYNKERVNNNPNLLRSGTVIELPSHAKLPATASQP